MAITLADFSKIWASTSPLTPYSFTDANYQEGWNFIGSTPPARQMWDFLQKNNDEKALFLANAMFKGNPLTLTADDGNGNSVSLVGNPNGSITWNGKELERVSAKSLGTNGYIRFESGLQMVWGEEEISSAKTYTFTVPFSANPVILGGTNSVANVSVTSVSATGFTGNLSSYPHGFRYIAIGKWK